MPATASCICSSVTSSSPTTPERKRARTISSTMARVTPANATATDARSTPSLRSRAARIEQRQQDQAMNGAMIPSTRTVSATCERLAGELALLELQQREIDGLAAARPRAWDRPTRARTARSSRRRPGRTRRCASSRSNSSRFVCRAASRKTSRNGRGVDHRVDHRLDQRAGGDQVGRAVLDQPDRRARSRSRRGLRRSPGPRRRCRRTRPRRSPRPVRRAGSPRSERPRHRRQPPGRC